MAPLRRYLRITKHSVLEVRIYLDRPADAEAWLLRRNDPALPRVIQAIRPFVLPKLREENERARGRGGTKAKKKGVKDVVIEDDFEVSIFLTDLSSRHSVLTKQKNFKDKPRIRSNSGKLTSWLTAGTSDQPMIISEDSAKPIFIREEEEEEAINLDDIPRADEKSAALSDEDYEEAQDDQKKKLSLDTSYDGFSIYGRILCLVVKRKSLRTTTGSSGPASGQQMLEAWVSTQAAADQVDDEEDG